MSDFHTLDQIGLSGVIEVYLKRETRTMRILAEALGVSREMMYHWLNRLNDEDKAHWTEAKAVKAEDLIDDAVEISDETVEDRLDVQRNKVRADTRLKAAAMLNERFRSNTNVNVNTQVVNVAQQHLEAVRRLAQLPRTKPTPLPVEEESA